MTVRLVKMASIRATLLATTSIVVRTGTTWKKINASLIASTLYGDSTVANGSAYHCAAERLEIAHLNDGILIAAGQAR